MLIVILWLMLSSANAQVPTVEQAKKYFEVKKYAEAKKILLSIKEESRDYAAAQFYLGRISFEEKNYEDAAEYFEEAVEINTKNAEYYTWLGDTYGTIAKDANVMRQGFLAPKMKEAWEQAILLDATSINPRLSLIEYYTQAPGFMGGSYEKAHEVANQIKKLNAAQGHRAAGNVYFKQEKFSEAEKEFTAMVKADPNTASSLVNFYVNQKQYTKAFAVNEESLKRNAGDMQAVYQAGRISAISGERLDAGEANLIKYLQYTPKPGEPSHAGAHMRLGNIYEKRGKKGEAKKAYETSLKLDANMKEAKEGLDRLK